MCVACCDPIPCPTDSCLVSLLRSMTILTARVLLDVPCSTGSFRKVNAENSKLVVSNRRAVLEQEMKELSRGDVVEG